MDKVTKHKVQTPTEASAGKLWTQAHTCLLLDVSGSMGEYVGSGSEAVRKIDILRLLTDRFTMRQFVFSSICSEGRVIPEPNGSTNLTTAFETVKYLRIKKVVLITDGLPDNPESALRAAQGLEVDVYYVGPEPPPAFIEQLVKQTGGQARSGQLLEGKLDQITQEIAGLIEGTVEDVIQG